MKRISVNRASAQNHTRKISGIASKLTASSFDVPRATRTTLSAMENGKESFADSQRLLMELAGLSRQSATTISIIIQNVINIDQQAATFFPSGDAP